MTLPIADVAASGALDTYTPGDPPTGVLSDASGPAAPDFTGKGYLLEETDERRVCQHVEKQLYKGQDKRMKPLTAQWGANELTVQGVPGVRTVYDAELGGWFARVPIGASAVRVGLAKSAELIHKTTATLLVDPPLPDCEPSPDDDGDRAKAELCTRILKNEHAESGLDLTRLLEDASNLGGRYGSGFFTLEVDPCGGGWVPFQIDAHPDATHYDPQQPDAVLQPPPIDPMAPLDPMGAPGEASEGPESMEAQPDAEPDTQPPIKRYLAPKGEDGRHPVVDDPSQADKRWQFKLRADVLTGRQVRFLPMTARGIEDADGVVIARVTTFGALRGLFPAIDGWPMAEQRKLMEWRPVPLRDVLPPGVVVDHGGQATVETGPRQGLPADEALCLTLTVQYRAVPSYCEGALVICAGESHVLHRETQTVWVGEGADRRPECLDIGLVQVRRYTDPSGGNPYGVGDAELLAPGDDLRQQMLTYAVEALWRINNPNVIIDFQSTVTPGEFNRRDGTAIQANLTAGLPQWEVVPPLDQSTLELYNLQSREMDSRSGLEETAQGVSSPDVKSGIHAQQVIEQALVSLSPLKRNLDAAVVRAWRIVLQRFRAYATQPQLLRYTGEDGRYQVKEWMNTDLGSTRDVRIARGTSTMLSRTAKQSLAQNELQLALATRIDPDGAWRRYQQAVASNVDATLGRDPDEHKTRVLRQIHAWRAVPDQPPAPPLGGMGPMGAADPMAAPPSPMAPPSGPPSVDPATGQPMPPMGPQPDPAALQAFAPMPVDAQPDVAKTRALALGEELARESTEQASPGKQLALSMAYDKARRDAGILFAAEQQAMQAAAQQQQAQQQADQQAHASSEKEKDRGAAQQMDDRKAGLAMQREQNQAAARQDGPNLGTGMAA